MPRARVKIQPCFFAFKKHLSRMTPKSELSALPGSRLFDLVGCSPSTFALILLGLILGVCQVNALDLASAVVLFPEDLSGPEKKAIVMLLEEVEKRTQIRWPSATQWPSKATPVIAVGPASAVKTFAGPYAEEFLAEGRTTAAEGYRIRIKKSNEASVVFVIGNDARGVLFGVGHLLRALSMSSGKITLADDLEVTSAPKYPLRGHQLGYRPKTNSYDGWDVAQWEQYIRDLVVFGANAIELIPPRSDDDADSPHFPQPPMKMMVEMSRLADEYGLEVWIWYPAMDQDYSDPKTVDFALKEWGEVFKQLPRIDAVFVPGGDPGHTQPRYLMALLQKEVEILHRTHPKAQMWISPQSFTQDWLDEFLTILKKDEPDWLTGLVFGPQVRISLQQLRAKVAQKYPIRHYPDITHSRQCQYPVPAWDVAYAVTEGREGINPRPLGQTAIFRLLQPYTIGFITYSEGCNDDVNKTIWSALGWNPDAKVIDILREYSRYFVGELYSDGFAQGLLALERNWEGPLIANADVDTTLAQFQSLEKRATASDLKNWRLQQALYRAYYDAYTRSRLCYETDQEARAMDKLREVPKNGSAAAMSRAEQVLDAGLAERIANDWRARIFGLAEDLYQSIRMQLSVPRYQAIAVGRGANLDTIDYPLNNRLWLKEQFDQIRELQTEPERLARIDELLNWTNPGPGGFYDDLGNQSREANLDKGLRFDQDPAFLESPHSGFRESAFTGEPTKRASGALRVSWVDHAEAMNDARLTMRYSDLDPKAHYKIRVVYGGDSPKKRIGLTANRRIEIHPLVAKAFPVRPVEFDIPHEATRSGELTLSWFCETGLGGNGRGCQVSEVWVIKK